MCTLSTCILWTTAQVAPTSAASARGAQSYASGTVASGVVAWIDRKAQFLINVVV